MLLICREWIPSIAQSYGRQAGMPNNLALHETGLVTMHASIKLLDMAPWPMRLYIGSIEIVASLWCLGFQFYYRYYVKERTSRQQEMTAFEKMTWLAMPLLRTYRHIAAMAWFDHPLVLKYFELQKAEPRPAPSYQPSYLLADQQVA